MRALRYSFGEAVASLWRGRRSGLLSTAVVVGDSRTAVSSDVEQDPVER